MPEPKLLGLIGVAGTIVFVLIVAVLTIVNWPFLQARGWDPVRASDVPYPSTLALGSFGWLQMLGFGILGLSVLAVAAGLWQVLDPRPTPAVLLVAIVGMAGVGLVAPTDGSLSEIRTWHGALHVAAFFALLIAFVLAAILLGLALGGLAGWASLAGLSVAAAIAVLVLTLASFLAAPVGGLASNLAIATMLVWIGIVAVQLSTIR